MLGCTVMNRRDVNKRNAHFLEMALLVIAAGLASLGLCGCTQPEKALTETAKPTRIAVAGSVDIYYTWDAARNGRLLALPLDVRNKGDDRDSLLVIERSKNGYGIRKVIDGGLFTSWSPGGDQLAFSREVNREVSPGIRGSRIGLYSSEKGSLALFPNSYVDKDPVWRHDGLAMAFARLKFGDPFKGQFAECRLIIVPVREGVLREAQAVSYQVAQMAAEALQWRPLSDKIAYVGVGRTRFKDGRRVRLNDIYLLDVGVGKTRKLTRSGDVERYSLAWSQDGKHIAFATGIAQFRTVEVIDVATDKCQVVLKASDIPGRKLQNVANIRWSPDGKHIVFDASKYEPGSITDIGVLEWPSRRFAWLTHDLRSKAPRWSDDGNILFIRKGAEVWQMKPDGTQQEKLYVISPKTL